MPIATSTLATFDVVLTLPETTSPGPAEDVFTSIARMCGAASGGSRGASAAADPITSGVGEAVGDAVAVGEALGAGDAAGASDGVGVETATFPRVLDPVGAGLADAAGVAGTLPPGIGAAVDVAAAFAFGVALAGDAACVERPQPAIADDAIARIRKNCWGARLVSSDRHRLLAVRRPVHADRLPG